jgi:hypothetical protein
MVFLYRTVTISGTLPDKEGVSAGMAEISTFLQDVGWNLIDDRSAEPATGTPATHMKYVFSSTGEQGQYPTFFLTLFSGTGGTTANLDVMGHQVHTAYDVGAHDVPSSGVVSDTFMGYVSNSLTIESQSENMHLYMSGDSEMVHIVSRKQITNNSTTMDNIMVGRFNSFLSIDESPYPLIAHGGTSTIVTAQTSARGIGGNPPQAFDANSEMLTLAALVLTNQTPYNIGAADSIFIATPLLVVYTDASPLRKDVAGTIRNGWRGTTPTTANMLNLSFMTASGTFGEQIYQSFTRADNGTIPSLILRVS